MRKFPFFLSFIISLNALLLFIWFYKQATLSEQQQPRIDVMKFPSTVALTKSIPDFKAIEDITERKTAYFDYIRPTVEKHNEYLMNVRQFLLDASLIIDEGNTLSPHQQRQKTFLADEYRVNINQSASEAINELLKKVDIIPLDLVLVQSANESGWGTSRFAQQGFNFFGLWCFVENCGFVPSERNDGASHEVAKFTNLEEAVYSYMRNLNRHDAYAELRDIRDELRQQNEEVTGEALVMGLTRYSERGIEYVEELQHMLRTNRELIEL